jgi:lysophospholipid acyltransferase (LPLAT)-like uncharacterized protein
MKIRDRRYIRVLAFVLAWVAKLWAGSLRARHISLDGMRHPADPNMTRCIYAVWHESFLGLLSFRTPIEVLISQHADGELIAQTCQFLNLGVVRGSTTRGGMAGLLELARGKRLRHILITPDGPRGPRQILKHGIVALASMTGLPIVLVGIGYARSWRMRSWDQMALPAPGSTIHGVLSEPIYVRGNLSRAELEQNRSRIERKFIQLTELAMRWARTGQEPVRLEVEAPNPELARCA